METVDVLIKNANELITLKGPNKPRTKEEMNNLSIIHKGDIAVKDAKIVDIGKNLRYTAETTIDAAGKTVMPGFVDPHTHLVFAGSREFELDMKLSGSSYIDILKKGGGIFYTVNETRKTSENRLIMESKKRLDNMIKHGTTTCEAKSGYGLDLKNELKILKVNEKLKKSHAVEIVSTFLGAHALPRDYDNESYVNEIINEMLPKVKEHAKFCDVFCEEGFFTYEQSKRILNEAKEYGMIPKVHADELKDTNGALLAAEVKAISADHLLKSNEIGIKEMIRNNVIGVLLPGTPFSLMTNEYANARKMIDQGLPIALATDLNPNCWIENMQFIIQLACFKMKMTPAEAITASTFNAACAIGLNDKIGSIEKGKQADIIVLDVPSYLFVPYNIGTNHVEIVIKKGKIMM